MAVTRVELAALRGEWQRSLLRYYGWIIVAVCCLTVSAARGTFAAFGVLLIALGESLGWSRAMTAAGALGLHGLAWALRAAPLGAFLDRWRPRRVFSGAAPIAASGTAIYSTTRPGSGAGCQWPR